MPLNNNAKHEMLNHLAGLAVRASLHSADPGANGANELAGGAPAYARKAIDWNAAAAGSLDNNANPVFDVPAGAQVRYFGLWSLDGNTFYGGDPCSPEDFTGQGTYTLTDVDITLTNPV